jgi:RNA polymerase sigma-70 factor, ECF subfamily
MGTDEQVARREQVEAAARGDHDAFAALASAAVDRLYGTAFLIVRDADRAEDAVQDALVKAWRQLSRLRDVDRFDAWLTRLVVNACYDEGRRIRRRAEVRLLPTHDRPAGDPGMQVIDRERLERGFRRLPLEQRAVLVLGQHLGLSHPEIAELLDIPLGTVKSRMRYALDAMRAGLEADDRAGSGAGSEQSA